MKSIIEISELIFRHLAKTIGTDLTIEDIEKILIIRNDLIRNDPELGWIDYTLIDREDKDELEESFRDTVYEHIRLSLEYDEIIPTFDELEGIFRYERDILFNVINIGTYYQILEDEPDMDFKREFIIEKWTTWKEKIEEAIIEFVDEFDIYPNMLIANDHTLSQFNFLVNNVPGEKKFIIIHDDDTDEERSGENEDNVVIGRYVYGDCTLHFFKREEVEDRKFILDYYDDFDFDDDDDDNDDDDDFTPVTPVPENIEAGG